MPKKRVEFSLLQQEMDYLESSLIPQLKVMLAHYRRRAAELKRMLTPAADAPDLPDHEPKP